MNYPIKMIFDPSDTGIDLRSFGFAPGDYVFRCTDPDHVEKPLRDWRGSDFGDKRSTRCRTCAMRRYEERQAKIAQQLADNERERRDQIERPHVRVPQLTRDKLVARHENETCRSVDRALTVALLVAKLHSEAEEIANDLTNAEEYGDLMTTLIALASLNGVSAEQINAAAVEKVERKGHLKEGNFWISKEFMDD